MKFKLLTGLLIAPVVVPLGINFSNHSSQNQSVVLSENKLTNDVQWSITDDGKIRPTNLESLSGVITVPETYNGKTVTGIAERAFYQSNGNRNITEIKLPNTIKVIERQAFELLYNVQKINIPESVTTIGNEAFYWCENLSSVNIPANIQEIGYNAFFSCVFHSINFDRNNQWFEWKGTENNGYLVRKDAEDKYACSTRLAVGEIDLTGSTIIKESAFLFCRGITMIHGMENVTEIQYEAFRYCTGLVSFTIPKKTKTLGNGCLQQLRTIDKIIFENDDINSINFGGKYVFWRTIPTKIIINAGINYLDNEQQTILFNTFINKFNSISFQTTISQYSTWYDSRTPSPLGAFNVFNLNTRIQTEIENGFKVWRDEKPTTRTVTLEYITSDNNISATGIINNNLSTIITTITGNFPNINAKDVTFTPRLHLRDSSNNFDKTVDLQSGTIHLEANTNYSVTKNTLNKSTEISNNRNGLWINGDTYDTRIVVNKAYFGQNWNNANYIKNNFNEYINVSGNGQTYQFNHANNTNIYTNPKIGQMTVTGVDQDTNPNSYLIKLWFSVPNSVDYQLLNQTITFDLKNAPSSSDHLFSINTCDKNQFDPNYNNFRANNLNLTSGERSGTIVWNDSDQTQFKNLGNTNTCKWAISKGYTLSLTNFTNDYISIDSNPRFDVNSNTLQVGVTQTKPVPQQTSVNVSGLKLKIMNGSTVIRQDITLPSLTVTLGASSTDITTTNLTYTGADQKSLRDKGDTASFDLTIPEVLKPQSDDQLINKFNFAYKGEGESTWTWDSVPPSETGVYKFQYQHDDETYTLTYQRVTNLSSDINPRYTYHITLTQEFDGKVKKDIEFSFIGASSSNPFEINADEFVPPSNNILGPVLGGVFGGILAIGLLSGTVVFISKRKRK